MNTRNPEQDVIDAIGDLVDEQLSGYSQRSGYDYNVNQDKCAVCGREWHGLALGGCPGPYGTPEQKTAYRNTGNPSYGQRRNQQGIGMYQTSAPTMFQVDVVPDVDVVPPEPAWGSTTRRAIRTIRVGGRPTPQRQPGPRVTPRQVGSMSTVVPTSPGWASRSRSRVSNEHLTDASPSTS